MNYEQKYKDALEKTKGWYENHMLRTDIQKVVNSSLEDIFPELKESEDEKIRKALVELVKCNERSGYTLLNNVSTSSMLAWLEKQGDKDKFIEKELECIKGYRENAIKMLEELEKQGEQEPNGNVEPKFKVGDWVILDENHNGVYQVERMDNYRYYLRHYLGLALCTLSVHNETIRLWTIQDAKDGDVLIHNGYVFVFMGIKDGIVQAIEEDTLESVPFGEPNKKNDYHPATKEQRDLLFQKMKEAGYEWNEEKKELKKIEQHPTDKVAPKFKVGDWITNGEYTWCVESVKLLDYGLIDKDGRSVYDDVSYVDSHFHLWTMRDAKDGNVLVDVYGNIGIIQEYDDFDWRSYCSLGCNGGFQGFNVEHENDKTHPATKEQRDLLFQKMKEEGYEWDEEKKELKKIEQKPAWSETDKLLMRLDKIVDCNIDQMKCLNNIFDKLNEIS